MLYSMLASAYTAALLVGHGAVAPQPRVVAIRMGANEMSSRDARVQLPLGVATGIALSQLFHEVENDLPGADDAKERARLAVVDADAEDAMAKYFPGALGSSTLDHKTAEVLKSLGYTKANTLFATSTCPDEVNSKPGEAIDLMKNRWGENFGLGGLGGVPFTGKAGFSAYAHHVPDHGKMFIMFAPHVGVEYSGVVGSLKRVNQDSTSTACGAAIGAYNAVIKEAMAKKANGVQKPVSTEAYGVQDGVSDYFDAQINFIKLKLGARLKYLDEAPDKMTYIVYQMYLLIREFFIDEILTAPGFWDDADELCVLGGIMINRGKGGDRFLPLMFQTREQAPGTTRDIYKLAFGSKPDLSLPLGGGSAEFYDYDLDTFQLTSERKSLLM